MRVKRVGRRPRTAIHGGDRRPSARKHLPTRVTDVKAIGSPTVSETSTEAFCGVVVSLTNAGPT